MCNGNICELVGPLSSKISFWLRFGEFIVSIFLYRNFFLNGSMDSEIILQNTYYSFACFALFIKMLNNTFSTYLRKIEVYIVYTLTKTTHGIFSFLITLVDYNCLLPTKKSIQPYIRRFVHLYIRCLLSLNKDGGD